MPLTPSLELLVTVACPHAGATQRLLEEVRRELCPGAPFTLTEVDSVESAKRLDFPGSPTIRIDGRDVEDIGHAPALACRLYGSQGTPPRWMVEAAFLRALAPEHVLFLCVANSARSQMAEGIARALAPAHVRVSSAGSEPSEVRPQALEAMREIGIDLSGHWSKGPEEVERPVSAVITLCAEEVCPVWLESSVRLHWGLPDPAGAGDDEVEEMEAFRRVRDELHTRLVLLFA